VSAPAERPVSGGNAELLGRWDAVMMENYGRPPLALVRGEGCVVWDADGRAYLDLLGGIAVSVLGHAHPAVVAAVSEQVGRLAHTSNLYAHGPGLALAERLVGLLGEPAVGARVFFCNSGAEANEAALKLARRHARALDPSGARHEIVAFTGAFHGRTMGALSVTGQPGKQEPFTPLVPGVRHVPWGDEAQLRAAVGPATAAVIVEPTLGEAGVIGPPAGFLAAIRAACDDAGALLILDEVQSGIGRTGEWFAFQNADLAVRPDVLTLAKGLGAGLPIGAAIGFGDAATALRPGDHGSTFGGNPVSCAAALAVLDTLEGDDLLASVRAVGARLAGRIAGSEHPGIAELSGRGLWRGIRLHRPVAPQVVAAAREAGFLVNATGPDRMRLAPPLILTAEQADAFCDALPGLLDEAGAAGAA
jgi:acetylornithine aminotransferase